MKEQRIKEYGSILIDEQKEEILLAYEESEDQNNLIEAKKIFKNIR